MGMCALYQCSLCSFLKLRTPILNYLFFSNKKFQAAKKKVGKERQRKVDNIESKPSASVTPTEDVKR